MTPYLTARERAARQSAQTAIARAQAHVHRPSTPDPDEELGRLYPYVDHTRAREIRAELDATDDDWWPTPTQEHP
ncbi:hypothetical protein [Phytohabitans aurantiacus]|uniref:Antitoxin VbhA domain-containing protein n=1 Tax=Phytohabitans aurantiacus TaxID=3016789 RepID=A0ABQ5QUN9_9ACTN|nr:hypothetical protein [Phytohabitans aurantiacus]GLH97371.1 hypothetical protein Pa4123_26460 [Phytohabitans aurantiacus]